MQSTRKRMDGGPSEWRAKVMPRRYNVKFHALPVQKLENVPLAHNVDYVMEHAVS
tara:strand:- start:146 stop:310 length:165 start_codon:yes stop_codon:yes gene_type:complete